MIVLWAILTLIAVVLLVLGVLLATPMHLRLIAEAGANARLRAEVRTLWGLSPRLSVDSATGGSGVRPPKRRRTPRAEAKPEKRRSGGVEPEKILRVLRALPDALMTAFGRIHVDRLRLRAAFGFDDPADTGQAFGLLTPLAYGLPSDRVEIGLEPDFERRRFEGTADLSLRLTPLAVAWPVLRLGLLIWRLRR